MLDLKELAEELDDLRYARDQCRHCGDEIAAHAAKGDLIETSRRPSALETVCDHDPAPGEHDEERLKALEGLEKNLGGDLHVASRDKGPFYEDGDEWEEYAEEMAYDIGMCQRDSALAMYVDWKKWADDLSSNYTTVEFDGTTYYYQE